MSTTGRPVALLILAFSLVWHLLAASVPPRQAPPPGTLGRDFASYHYAAQVALAGGDPYQKEALDEAARVDGTRDEVHPFFYPPPFLLSVAWAPSVGLTGAFRAWFWLNELLLGVAVVALWRHWAPLGPAVGPTLALAVATSAGVAYGQELGQANLPVLALIAGALHQQGRRPWLAGVLLGTACMWKMSPALLVAWWLLRREWVAAAVACVWAVALSVLTLPLVGPITQLAFYRDVLPRFGSGDYNGLVIQISMFANHSVPNLLDQVWPGVDNRLSATARLVSGGVGLALVGGMAVAFRERTTEPVREAAQASAVMVAMVLVPVYTYEHHLVFALPALVVATLALGADRLAWGWAPAIGFAWAWMAVPVPNLRQLVVKLAGEDTALAWLIQEGKFGALVVLFAACLWLGARRSPAEA